jgi:hypothetical protein
MHDIVPRNSRHEESAEASHKPIANDSTSHKGKSLKSCAASSILEGIALVAPRLELLPVELIENIGNYLPRQDFVTFRQSNSILCDRSMHIFTKRFFERRVISLRLESLQHLTIILNDAKLGSAIKHLVIWVETHSTFFATQQRSRSMLGSSTWYQQVSGQATLLQAMLNQTLNNIPALASLDLQAKYPDGMSPSAVAMVMVAMASSSNKLHALRIGGCRVRFFHENLWIGGFFDSSYKIQTVLTQECKNLRRTFGSLKHLEFSWNAADFVVSEQDSECTNKLLSLTSSIEVLTIYEQGFQKNNCKIDCLSTIAEHLPKLRTLNIFDPFLDATNRYLKGLARFLQTYGAKVEEVHIHLRYPQTMSLDDIAECYLRVLKPIKAVFRGNSEASREWWTLGRA